MEYLLNGLFRKVFKSDFMSAKTMVAFDYVKGEVEHITVSAGIFESIVSIFLFSVMVSYLQVVVNPIVHNFARPS